MRRLVWFCLGIVFVALVAGAWGLVFLRTRAQGFSARLPPSALEAYASRTAWRLALPAAAKEQQNPISASPEVLAEAGAHWADHCAGCHSNDGSGSTPLGKQMYPPAPDMRKERTQQLTDGELFYIIENGIRLTGMPAWGTGKAKDAQDTWKLVRFIRHLPGLSAGEVKEMEKLNPKSPDELKEEQDEEEFLNGGEPHEPTEHHHHH